MAISRLERLAWQRHRGWNTTALVNKLNDAQKKGELGKFLKQFSKVDLLICDEWGYFPLDRDGS